MMSFRQTTIRSTFDKVSKRMPLYEYVYVGAVHKSFQYNFTFFMKGHTSGLAQSHFQPYYKFTFSKISTCYLKHPGSDVKLIYAFLHFEGLWQTVQIQIRRYITKVASVVMDDTLG